MNDLETVCQELTTEGRETYISYNNTNRAWIRLFISQREHRQGDPGERERSDPLGLVLKIKEKQWL